MRKKNEILLGFFLIGTYGKCLLASLLLLQIADQVSLLVLKISKDKEKWRLVYSFDDENFWKSNKDRSNDGPFLEIQKTLLEHLQCH